jgi:hypothetical protein
MPKLEPLLVELWEEERAIAERVRDFVDREKARGHSFSEARGTVKRLDGLAVLSAQSVITPSLRTAGRRYASEYGAFFDKRRFPSTLAYQTRENDATFVDEVIDAGLILRETRNGAFGSRRELADICDLVCGRGARCPTAATPLLLAALAGLVDYYAGAPSEEDFECHLPVLLTLRDEGARAARVWVSFKDQQSRIFLRPVLARAQAHRCAECEAPIGKTTGTIDHVFPRARGGPDMPGNLLLLCEPCNKAKAHGDPSGGLLRTLGAVNAALGWATPSVAMTDASEIDQRQGLLKALRRLAEYEAGASPLAPKRARSLAAPVAPAVAIDNDWPSLLPIKAARDDRAMRGTWLREQGVLRRNRGNRKMGVNHG